MMRLNCPEANAFWNSWAELSGVTSMTSFRPMSRNPMASSRSPRTTVRGSPGASGTAACGETDYLTVARARIAEREPTRRPAPIRRSGTARASALLVGGVVDVALVVGDGDALTLALEQTGLADDALGSFDGHGPLRAELELGGDVGVVDDIRELVPGLQLEDVDRADVPAVSATGALRQLDIHLNHFRAPPRWPSTWVLYLSLGPATAPSPFRHPRRSRIPRGPVRYRDDGAGADRNQRVGVPGVGRPGLPEGAGRRPPAPLQPALPDRRGELHLLRAPSAVAGEGL